MDAINDWLKIECTSAADALVQPVSFLSQPAHKYDLSGDFWM